jgi:cytidylate kinase
MINLGSLGRHGEVIEHVQKHWEERRQVAAGVTDLSAPTGLSIAVARQAGVLGTTIAREVGARLNWPVYDYELLERIAQEMGLRANLLESVDERHQHWLVECVHAFSLEKRVTESKYVRHLVETILSLGAHGHCVIVGRGAAHILPMTSTLRVNLVASLADRIDMTARRMGLSHEEAARKVEEINRDRTRFITDHFEKDPNNPVNFDLILNCSRWSIPESADLIVQALHRLEAQTSRTS